MGERLDVAMVARGLSRSRSVAREAVEAGTVRVNGEPCRKASKNIENGDVVELESRPRFVGRGGIKLEAALEHFEISIEGRRCLDVGASTGGFTDCLLQHGAGEVVAVDVGHGQMAEEIRKDPRVKAYEGINIRETPPAPWSGKFERVVVDVSFISLALVLPALWQWADDECVLVLLIKPQFECGREAVGRSGVVRDPDLRAGAVDKIRNLIATEKDWRVWGVMPSPIAGGDGNEEFLLVAGRGGGEKPLMDTHKHS
jgi:23S rRNA (cytidine1920-2'-O)/16S rRNA (cytidine1409-2'-O)-methyltransferase